jgi:hypothetical protein
MQCERINGEAQDCFGFGLRRLPAQDISALQLLSAELLMVLASQAIPGFESHETHDHSLLPDGCFMSV